MDNILLIYMCHKGDRGERPLLWIEKKLTLTGRKTAP
nr:MAG TPA: hypothetical protein [Caudoviricetes sp.]